MQKKLIVVPRATLEIYNYEEDGLNIYEFDATECSPPEPMVNTIVTLEMLKNKEDRLKVKFFHEPQPLFEKVAPLYTHISEELEGGDFLVTFKKR
jgi:hypothetical protein